MKEKKISVILTGKSLDIVENTAKRLKINKSKTIRLFIKEDKIVVIDNFNELFPLLNQIRVLLKKSNIDNDTQTELKKAVNEIWQLLNAVTADKICEKG